ncbi:hypothetical protein HYALB_00005615 [Hymenoscyphus albidus]|uniref:P-loop containing nucleoside triphosphate hydrolase protein n=1 Tax=Hymenoscyphus albidus TaxID=595503 RepID=A0A9N9LN50_9HELO|nr:hypothetical protein HYALB_00005615 [Hymenoscyphus albidus]
MSGSRRCILLSGLTTSSPTYMSPRSFTTLCTLPHRRSIFSTPSKSVISHTQGYVGNYEAYAPTKGPLSLSSKHGVSTLTPSLLKKHLDKFVVGQDKAKKVTSVAIYNHYQRIREIRRQDHEEQEKRDQRARQEARQRIPPEFLQHPVETDYNGQPQTADLNKLTLPEAEPELELGSRPLEESRNTIIEKSNLLLLGPSGVGKTYILQTLSRVLEVPFATVDCSSLTQAGYIGTDIESAIERLLLASSHSVQKCESGIIFFDELDKLAKPAVMTHGRDVSGEGVQQGLLKMIEGTTVTINAKPDAKSDAQSSSRGDRLERGGREIAAQQGKSEQFTIDTTNILFVFAGAFVGLEKIISKRLATGSSIGFGAPIRAPPVPASPKAPQDILSQVNTNDLQSYGLIPELLGRIPITVSLTPLSLPQLVSILTEPKNSLVKQYTALFETFGVKLRFTTASLHAIAEQALPPSPNPDSKSKDTPVPGMGVGARGLRAILESVLQECMYVTPGSDIRFCLIDEQFVREHFKRTSSKTPDASGKELLPLSWPRSCSVSFEQAYEAEELEWDRKQGRESYVEDSRDNGGFDKLRAGGSSGM